MFARKLEHETDPQLKIVEAAATTPPGMESWFAVVRINATPRIVLVDDIQDRTGFTYVKCILMGCGTVVWVEESNLVMWVWAPTTIPKPVQFQLHDDVELTTNEKGTVIALHGDLVCVLTHDGYILRLARWDIKRNLTGCDQ